MAKPLPSRVLILLGGLAACTADAEQAPPENLHQAALEPSVLRRDAQELIRRFQREAPSTRAQLFGRPMLEDLLSHGDSPTVRLLFGLDPAEHREHLVLTADSMGDGATRKLDSGELYAPSRAVAPIAFDRGGLCPPACPPGEAALVGTAKATMEDLTAQSLALYGARISGSLARTLTTSFRAAHPGDRANLCLSRARLARLLADPEVHGVWFFFGRSANDHRALILAPADHRGALLAPRSIQAAPSILGAVVETQCGDEADEMTPDW